MMLSDRHGRNDCIHKKLVSVLFERHEKHTWKFIDENTWKFFHITDTDTDPPKQYITLKLPRRHKNGTEQGMLIKI